MTPVYLLLLPALAHGNIFVYIDVRTDPSLIDVIGHSSVPLPEKERQLFKLEDEQLKKSVANYSGVTPTDVFARNDWGNIYGTIVDSREIVRTFKPTLKTKTTTKTTPPKCIDAPLNLNVSLTVSSTWPNSTVPTKEKVGYEIVLDYDTFAFESFWGEKIDASNNYSLPTNKLVIKKCTFVVYLDFEASVFGDVAANYMEKRSGHHFWAFDVNKVQAAAGLPNTLSHQEIITIEYYR